MHDNDIFTMLESIKLKYKMIETFTRTIFPHKIMKYNEPTGSKLALSIHVFRPVSVEAVKISLG